MIRKQRPAFSMLTAVFLIVIMATVAIFVFNLSGKMVKATTVQYQREQAALLARSYAEFAILAVTGNEHNSSSCLNNINGTFGDYNVDVNISYIGNGLLTANGGLHANCRTITNAVTSSKTPLSIMIDVFVHYSDYDHPDDLNMTYHRRYLEKI